MNRSTRQWNLFNAARLKIWPIIRNCHSISLKKCIVILNVRSPLSTCPSVSLITVTVDMTWSRIITCNWVYMCLFCRRRATQYQLEAIKIFNSLSLTLKCWTQLLLQTTVVKCFLIPLQLLGYKTVVLVNLVDVWDLSTALPAQPLRNPSQATSARTVRSGLPRKAIATDTCESTPEKSHTPVLIVPSNRLRKEI